MKFTKEIRKMIKKDLVEKNLAIVEKIVGKFSLTNSLGDRVKELKEIADGYQSKVVLMGRFSAGKSALLNCLMEKAVLMENQGPETAIATELYYDSDEHFEFFDKEGHSKSFYSGDIPDIDSYKYGKCFVDNEFIKVNNDIVFVDMPGLDSNIERHNKAILQYIDQASAYVLLTDCEDGTLHQSVIDFMNEVKTYQSNLVVLITKCDKKLPDDIELVQSNVSELVNGVFDEVIPISTANVFQPDLTKEHFLMLIDSIDFQKIFEKKFNLEISNLAKDVNLHLQITRKGMKYDSKELEKQKEQNEDLISEKLYEMRRQKSKLHDKFFKDALPKVMLSLKHVLEDNINVLVDAGLESNEKFTQKVNDLIRPVLVEKVNEGVMESVQGFLENVEIEVSDALNGQEITNELKNRMENVKRILEPWKLLSDNDKKSKLKLLLSSLAIATDVIAPWLELIIVFLPDIIGCFSEWRQSKQIEEFKTNLRCNVIPQIVEKLRPDVESSFAMLENEAFAKITEQFENFKENLRVAYENILAKSESEKAKLEEDFKEIDSAFAELQNLIG